MDCNLVAIDCNLVAMDYSLVGVDCNSVVNAKGGDLDPPLCAKFVPRISVDIWIKGGLGPTMCAI